MTLENPIRAIREIRTTSPSNARCDWRTAARCRPSTSSRRRRAPNERWAYADTALGFPDDEMKALGMWERVMTHRLEPSVQARPRARLGIKHNLIEAYRAKHGLGLDDARVQLLDLQYHDVRRQSGIFYRMPDLD
ncbi:MAG: proteasome accessory factor PafA2 family protein [Acidimicrobiales bacterium]